MSERFKIYRMVMDKHICPYGLLAKSLLNRKGYAVADYHLKTKEETDAFKNLHAVQTTPQIFLGTKRIGGYDELKTYFGIVESNKRYRPIIAIFSSTLLMSLAFVWPINEMSLVLKAFELFVALSMCVLAILKLKDIEGFVIQFLNYDLLAQRYVRYAYFYPIAELIAGAGMLSAQLTPFAIPVSFAIGTLGGISVFKAVYIDKRELKCACVGGNSKVPLGFISLTENLMMICLPIWMFCKIYLF